MADSTELDFVAASVRRATRLQREYAETFLEHAAEGSRFIGQQFAQLCDLIDEIVDYYEARYRVASDDAAPDEDHRKMILNALQELLARTRDLQLRQAWLDAAATPPIDLGSFYYLAGLARAIVRDDAQLTVVAAHEGSYATLVNPFRPKERPVPPDIVLVAHVPRREIQTGLLHPLLVHEIGHGAAHVHGLTAKLMEELAPGAVDEALDSGAEQQASRSKRSSEHERDVLAKRLHAWIEEIFCDAIGTACLGATYLFSFATEVLPDDIDAASTEHPSTRQRVRLILEHLDRLGWDATLKREVPAFMGWVRGIAAMASGHRKPDDEALRGAIDLIGRRVQDRVDEHVKARLFHPDDAALEAVLGLLEQRVPPAQQDDRKPIGRPTIIAGCWLSALKSRGGGIDALADAVDSPELARLLPYALELSVIVEKWETA